MLQLKPNGLAHASANAISVDSLTECPWCCEANGAPVLALQAKGGKKGARVARALVVSFAEIAWTEKADTFGETRDPDYLSELTVSFLRPCARRRERTARPSAVFMRFRKPCVLARRRLFG